MNNPPAFPISHVHTITELRDREIERDREGQRGMTLRDYFAAKAMQVLIETDHTETSKIISMTAYDFADAMLKVREQ